MDLRMTILPNFDGKILSVIVAERSKASDQFRSFGQKLRWGPDMKFFFKKKILILG